ncbi:unnamed protein product, partial [Allacma fusca]
HFDRKPKSPPAFSCG